jgi:hypothetical protein
MAQTLDVLTLAGIPFTGFSPPDTMSAGGQQAMVVHKLPGGSRVIDTLGPDEDDISWRGTFYGDDAYANALILDGIRAAGDVVALSWAGQYRQVVVRHFKYHIRRLPIWVEYEISCVVSQNPSLGNLGSTAASIDTLVAADLGTAVTQAGL